MKTAMSFIIIRNNLKQKRSMKNKMKLVVAMLVFAFSLQTSFAQPDGKPEDGKKREKIESLKRAYITDKLELSVTEAEKFWPVYNANDKQKGEIRKAIREKHEALEAGSKSEKDAIAAIEFITQKRKEEADLDAKFFKDCLPVLGVDKTVKLATSEREFHRDMMKNIRGKGDGKGGDKGPKGPKGEKGGKGQK